MISLQRYSILAAWTFVVLGATSLFAQTGPVIPGYEQFHAQASDAAGGELLLSELNCVACHAEANANLGNLPPKSAPILSMVGSRVRPEYLREYLQNPHQRKPGATMPDVLGGLPVEQREDAIENLTHFLASTGRLQEGRRRSREVREGQQLYHQVGCVACHGPREGGEVKAAHLKPLGKLEAKYSVPALAAFLQDPLKVRASGRMPSLRLSDADAGKIAQYLLQDLDVEVPANLHYSYYEEANLSELPDFSKLTPKETGETMSFDLGLAKRKDNFGLVFEGFLNIGQAGEYTFHLDSDDGSRLEIDGKQVVINNGIHPKQRRSGKIRLRPGMHELRVEYFEGAGQEAFDVTFDGPGGLRNAYVADHVFLSKDKANQEADDSFRLDPQRVEQGRLQFVSLGCANCHTMNDLKADPGVLQGPSLAELDLAKGCLASKPGRAPDFQLTEGQRKSLAAAITHRKQPDVQPWQPEQQVQHYLTTFNCYACHQRDEIGGVSPELNAFFHTTQEEMGDEGRIPPTLTGVGGKLSPTWMKKVLREGAKDRPYMQTVMPNFGGQNVGDLAPLLASLDALPEHPPIDIPETEGRIKATGRHMVGDKVFGCIKCHTFAGEKASGVQGIDMTLMTKRLNHDWFLAYVIDPPRFRKGTRMPTAWPNGKSVMRNILSGDADQQVEAIWRYLQDGEEAAKPFGVGQQAIELVAWRKAVIYRNFIEGAGSRAIGVGFPEKANLAFDATNMNLALIWQGSFIDASRHWNGRGQGFQPPLGDNVVRLPGGAPWAVLANPADKWPTATGKEAGYQFLGYRLDELNNPTFRYRFGDLTVSEAFHAEKSGEFPSLLRTITVDGHTPEGTLMFRALSGADIHSLGDGWYQLGEGLKVQVTGANATLRDDHSDLVVEVPDGSESTFTLKYVW